MASEEPRQATVTLPPSDTAAPNGDLYETPPSPQLPPPNLQFQTATPNPLPTPLIPPPAASPPQSFTLPPQSAPCHSAFTDQPQRPATPPAQCPPASFVRASGGPPTPTNITLLEQDLWAGPAAIERQRQQAISLLTDPPSPSPVVRTPSVSPPPPAPALSRPPWHHVAPPLERMQSHKSLPPLPPASSTHSINSEIPPSPVESAASPHGPPTPSVQDPQPALGNQPSPDTSPSPSNTAAGFGCQEPAHSARSRTVTPLTPVAYHSPGGLESDDGATPLTHQCSPSDGRRSGGSKSPDQLLAEERRRCHRLQEELRALREGLDFHAAHAEQQKRLIDSLESSLQRERGPTSAGSHSHHLYRPPTTVASRPLTTDLDDRMQRLVRGLTGADAALSKWMELLQMERWLQAKLARRARRRQRSSDTRISSTAVPETCHARIYEPPRVNHPIRHLPSTGTRGHLPRRHPEERPDAGTLAFGPVDFDFARPQDLGLRDYLSRSNKWF